MFKSEQASNPVNFEKYNVVFCDSIQALDWAYENGLPNSAIIKSRSPAVLWSKKENIQNIEARWTSREREIFQSTVRKLTEDIFDIALNISNVDRELALTISQSVFDFQNILYKASCLEASDFTDPRLFIYVEGRCGPEGNMMNSPWDKLLSLNPYLSTVKYTLQNDEWNVLNTRGITYWQRLKIAGFETIIYRLSLKLMKKLPDWLFKREVFMQNENDLLIETAAHLIKRGVRVTEIQIEPVSGIEKVVLDANTTMLLYKAISPVIRKRVEQWVTPFAVEVSMSLFKSHFEKQLKQFELLVNGWKKVIVKDDRVNRVVLANSVKRVNGHALSYVCRSRNIPLISSPHGVTGEINKAHSMLHILFNCNVANVMFLYNHKFEDVVNNIHFNNAKHYVTGAPMRLIRMKYTKITKRPMSEIVYISTNLYSTGFSMSLKTDYIKAREECKIITKVLGKLPHKVRYKTYPEDNRRYADMDPVLSCIKDTTNIELFSDKIDMRYLISDHRIFVTTTATSTLEWPVMSGKPVIFINQKNNSPLTAGAHKSISKGLFVFDDDQQYFHEKLRDFLSQPIDTIEKLWQEKKSDREEMIRMYFSEYSGGSGERAAKILLREYL